MIACEQKDNNYVSGLYLWARENSVPLTLTMELTPLCNFNCLMCYVRLTKTQADEQGNMLSVQEWLEIAEQAKKSGTLNITITGGEPLMYPGFWELYAKLNKMGFLISILSNGSLIDSEAINNFRTYGMPSMVKMTIYGASDETYQKVCGSADGFSRLSDAIDLFQEEKVPVILSSTVVRENASDLKLMYEFAELKGIPLKHTVSVLKSSRVDNYSVEKSRFAFADFSDELSLEYLEKSKFKWTDDPFGFCASKRNSLFVTWNGHFQLCSFLTEPFIQYNGNFEGNFRQLITLIDKINNPSECSECEWREFCQRCPAILCSESGHPERINKDFCKMAKRLYEIYKLKKGI